MADPYRSYVVRVRRSITGSCRADRTRVEVEDLLGGRRATVTGGPAEALGDRLEAIVSPDGPTPGAGPRPGLVGPAKPADALDR